MPPRSGAPDCSPAQSAIGKSFSTNATKNSRTLSGGHCSRQTFCPTFDHNLNSKCPSDRPVNTHEKNGISGLYPGSKCTHNASCEVPGNSRAANGCWAAHFVNPIIGDRNSQPGIAE